VSTCFFFFLCLAVSFFSVHASKQLLVVLFPPLCHAHHTALITNYRAFDRFGGSSFFFFSSCSGSFASFSGRLFSVVVVPWAGSSSPAACVISRHLLISYSSNTGRFFGPFLFIVPMFSRGMSPPPAQGGLCVPRPTSPVAIFCPLRRLPRLTFFSPFRLPPSIIAVPRRHIFLPGRLLSATGGAGFVA